MALPRKADRVTTSIQPPTPRKAPNPNVNKTARSEVRLPKDNLPEQSAPSSPAETSPAAQAARGADVDELPRPVSNPAPVYPPAALTARLTGRVLLTVTVDAQGKVTRAAVHTSSGHRQLDNAALAAVRGWRFRPAIRAGRAVEYEIGVPVRFRLRNQ